MRYLVRPPSDRIGSLPEHAFAVGPHTLNAVAKDKIATVDFSVGERVASAEHSTIAASPTTVNANGTGVSAVTVTARDADGVALTKGGATVEMIISTAGPKTISEKLNGATVNVQDGGNMIALFKAGTVAVSDFTVGTQAVQVGNAGHTVTVRLAGVFGNPVVGAAAELAATAADLGVGVVSGFSETATSGTARQRLLRQ